jgi:hypothetical protein
MTPIEQAAKALEDVVNRCDEGPYDEESDSENAWVHIHVSRQLYERCTAALARLESEPAGTLELAGRLRRMAKFNEAHTNAPSQWSDVFNEAADTLTSLAQENERLREVLLNIQYYAGGKHHITVRVPGRGFWSAEVIPNDCNSGPEIFAAWEATRLAALAAPARE